LNLGGVTVMVDMVCEFRVCGFILISKAIMLTKFDEVVMIIHKYTTLLGHKQGFCHLFRN
jgi:hypothetical protein